MGKKRLRKKMTSRGIHSNVATGVIQACRQPSSIMNKIEAWKAGKRGKITIANPNKQETNRRFIKVTFEQYFGGTYKNIMQRIKPATDNDKAVIQK